ncbi:MAG: hypothetical protein KME26_03230 [Oscillatoria princeps RMCB-10]|nr:hypothetical protein [Oscillatoria princeps RMCB-10]
MKQLIVNGSFKREQVAISTEIIVKKPGFSPLGDAPHPKTASVRTSHNPQTVRCWRKCARPFPFVGLMPISHILALSACHTGIPNIRTGRQL